MKRYLALTIEEVIDKFKVFGSILCKDDRKTFDVFLKYLYEDVNLKPRYELIKTKANLEKYYHKYMKETPLSEISATSFKEYLIKDDIEEDKNDATDIQYFNRLTELANSMFKWQNLPEKTCKNCRYCDLRNGKYYCIGEKEAPEVRPIDMCDSFKYRVTDLW